MRPRLSFWLLPFALIIAVGACGDDEIAAPPDLVVTGEWVGNGGTGNGSFRIEATLSETGGQVTGEGRFRVNSQTVATFSVTGEHTHPNVFLTIVPDGFEEAVFTGAWSGNNRLEGELNGSGFVGTVLAMDRTGGQQ